MKLKENSAVLIGNISASYRQMRQPEPKVRDSQGQNIDFEIINPRDRATHGVKREKICRTAGRLAEVRIKSRTITKLYLTGDLNSWNDAKRAEKSERVKHGTEF